MPSFPSFPSFPNRFRGLLQRADRLLTVAEPVSVSSLASPLPAPGTVPILRARDLLALPNRRECIDRIEELAGTTRSHFDVYYLAPLRRFALWAQQLPASEAHHHAYPGGLLDHGLEVAVAALRIRQGYLLPPGAPPEEAVLKKDLWTYAAFALALLHDAAKPAVDQAITLYGEDLSSWPWNPWAGPLGAGGKARWYRVAFRRGRDYRSHRQALLLLAPCLIGPEGLDWLQSDPAVWAAWLAYAAGDDSSAGVLADILGRADSESVARSLGAGAVSAAATAPAQRSVPLHEKLAAALRHLIDSGEIPMNRRGATAWRTGGDLWLVSKAAMDALRAALLRDGHAGIPADNNRLFDILQDHGLLVPNGEGKAIWRMTVKFGGQADTLTLLRVPLDRLWPDSEAAPPEFAGAVEPSAGPDQKPPATTEPAAASRPAETVPEPEQEPARGFTPPSESAPDEGSGRTAGAPSAGTQQPEGRRFLDWLAEGLQSGRLEYNTGKARVHVVPEGVLLASPGVFRDYAAANGTDWTAVQRSFFRLKLHQPTTAGHNVHQYAVARSGSVLTGCLLPDAARLFGTLQPAPNPLLARQ